LCHCPARPGNPVLPPAGGYWIARSSGAMTAESISIKAGSAPIPSGEFTPFMTDLQPLWDWFRELYATTGIKLTIFYDAFDRARFFNGFLTSVRLMSLCILCSIAVGVLGAWAQGSRLRLVRALTAGYIEFFRNTPPLVQLYFFYFALGSYLR